MRGLESSNHRAIDAYFGYEWLRYRNRYRNRYRFRNIDAAIGFAIDSDSDPDSDSEVEPCSVLSLRGASIGACEFPPAHEFDPVERRPAVPTLDKNRAAEARRVERLLPAQIAAVCCAAVAGV